jgi:hypothetical protein
MTRRIPHRALRIGIVVAVVVAGYLGATYISTFNAPGGGTCENDGCGMTPVMYGGLVVQIQAMCVDDPLSETGCDSKSGWPRSILECETYQCDSD